MGVSKETKSNNSKSTGFVSFISSYILSWLVLGLYLIYGFLFSPGYDYHKKYFLEGSFC